jgi:hypothetical protein
VRGPDAEKEAPGGENNVAEHLTVEKPKVRRVTGLPENRPTRRSLTVKQMDKDLVLALAAATTSHLSNKPRKSAKR